MGYFLHKFGLTPFREAEADNQDIGDPNEETTDYTEDSSQQADSANNEQEQPQEDNQDANDATQDQQPDDMPPEEETTDYSEEDAAAGGDDSYDDTGDGQDAPSDGGGEEEQPVDELKQQEEELYSNLTDDQLDIRHKELKSQFLSMFDITTSIIDKIGDANTNEDNIGVIEYISDNLSRLRTMLTDYIENVYAGKSYIENSVNYTRFLAVLNGINKLLEELEKKQDN